MASVKTEVDADPLGAYLNIDDYPAIRCVKYRKGYLVTVGQPMRPGYKSGFVDRETARGIVQQIAYKLMSMATQI